MILHLYTLSLLTYCCRSYSVSSSIGGHLSLALSGSSQGNIPSNQQAEDLFNLLSSALDKYILSGSSRSRQEANNIYKRMIDSTSKFNLEEIQKAKRMINRAGMPLDELDEPYSDQIQLVSDVEKRKLEADKRRDWEQQFSSSNDSLKDVVSTTIHDKIELVKDLISSPSDETTNDNHKWSAISDAEKVASEVIARAGAGTAFDGNVLGIGGLDEVLSQVKRRIWVPLAAPPSLLQELGTHPVRGLLLYGQPGCGKSLLARSLGKILSPARPQTVVSGPEVMDRFVGSSEANIRKIFDDPPEIYDSYRLNTTDNGKALEKAALHVIIMDEFDAIARARGGQDGKGDQGDAGVARDSVVNQLLAKMDGVEALAVPTLVIGLTNKRSLIDKALLRPGRFEVAIEVPPPRTISQRMSILNVHMKNMFRNGRLLVRDAPIYSAASDFLRSSQGGVLSYEELLHSIAGKCDKMSGASLAAITRAAASRALERAVFDFTDSLAKYESHRSIVSDCVVTLADFEQAVCDVLESSHESDTSETVV